jgi:hypothetical protein
MQRKGFSAEETENAKGAEKQGWAEGEPCKYGEGELGSRTPN